MKHANNMWRVFECLCVACLLSPFPPLSLSQGLPREIAFELLQNSDDGAFIVRDSQSAPGNYALTLKAHGSIHNFVVLHHRVGGLMQ